MALDKDTIVGGLGGLGRSPVHLKHAFLSLSLPDKEITNIDAIREYQHLQVVDMPNNSITDISALSALPHVQRVNFQNNQLTRVLNFEPEPLDDTFADHEFRVAVGSALDEANLTNNDIEEIDDLSQHRFLRKLLLGSNRIFKIQGLSTLSHLQHLSLADNGIKKIEGLDCLPLKYLDLSHNRITVLDNLHTLVQLQVLLVSGNTITSLNGIQNCKALNVLEAENNVIENIHELHHLADLPLLSRLSLAGNTVTDTLHYRLRVLVYTNNHLEYLDRLRTSAEEKVKGANLFGADAEHRKEVHERHIEEEPFVNYMPPFEDDEEKKAEARQASEKFQLHVAATEYVDDLIDGATGPMSPTMRRASQLVDGIIDELVEQLEQGTVDSDRLK